MTDTSTAILTQILGVSQRDLRGSQALVYAPAPVVQDGPTGEPIFQPIQVDMLTRQLQAVRTRVEELLWRARLNAPREQCGIESVAEPLATHILPAEGLVSVVAPGLHPHLDTIYDVASQVPWEIIEENYALCRCARPTMRVRRGSKPYPPLHCEACGALLQEVGGKLAIDRHITHLVRGGKASPGGGNGFLIVEDPTLNLCTGEADPTGQCQRHLDELKTLLAKSGYEVRVLGGKNATTQGVLGALASSTLVGLYYFGHGIFPPNAEQGCLLMSDGPLYAKEIEDLNPSLRFAFLNACEAGASGLAWTLEKKYRSVGHAFARGGPQKIVIAPLWPVLSVQAVQAAKEFFRAAVAGHPLELALREVRQSSLARYEAGQPDISWMAYRYFGDPNRPLPPAQAASTVTVSGLYRCRLFGEDHALDVELFSFDVRDVLLRAAKRRNLQGRKLVSAADFLAGLVRTGHLTRFVLRLLKLDPDHLYEQITQEQEEGPRIAEPLHFEDLEREIRRVQEEPGSPTEKLAGLRQQISAWSVRARDQFDTGLIAVLERADQAAQARGAAAEEARISEQDLLEALGPAGRWAVRLRVPLPPVEALRDALRRRTAGTNVDENGHLRLAALTPSAQRVIELAHEWAQQRGICPIPNRLLLAAFLKDRRSPASQICRQTGTRAEMLSLLLVAATASGSPDTFVLSPESADGSILPMLERGDAHQRNQGWPQISEALLFHAYCETAPERFKAMLRELPPPMTLDLDSLAAQPLPQPDAAGKSPPSRTARPAPPDAIPPAPVSPPARCGDEPRPTRTEGGDEPRPTGTEEPRTQPRWADENVQFTVFRPRRIPPDVWCDLVASAHLESNRPGTPEHIPEPLERARQKAHAVMRNVRPQDVSESIQDSRQAVPQGEQITFVPQLDGVQFNPPQHMFLWDEDEHTVQFRMRAAAAVNGKTVRGALSVYLGAILIADVPLRMEVSCEATFDERSPGETEPVPAYHYRKIFASYSHKDLAIVRQFERYAEAVGDEYLRDWMQLRPGDRWSEKLLEMIDQADVFQLFWSTNSMTSEHVRREWEHALKLRREGFVRPVYWEQPFPQLPPQLPPPQLAELHFQQLSGDFGCHVPAAVLVPEASSAAPATALSASSLAAFPTLLSADGREGAGGPSEPPRPVIFSPARPSASGPPPAAPAPPGLAPREPTARAAEPDTVPPRAESGVPAADARSRPAGEPGGGVSLQQFDPAAQAILAAAMQWAHVQGYSVMRSPHLFAGLLAGPGELLGRCLRRHQLRPEQLLPVVLGLVRSQPAPETAPAQAAVSPSVLDVLQEALRLAAADGRRAGELDLGRAMLKDRQGIVPQTLHRLGCDSLTPELLRAEAAGQSAAGEANRKEVAATWTIELTSLARAGQLVKIAGRNPELSAVVRTLADGGRPLLVGDPGVGKGALAEGLAQWLVEGLCPAALRGKRVHAAPPSLLLDVVRFPELYERRFELLLAEAGNEILFLDEIDRILVNPYRVAGHHLAGQLLEAALADPQVQIVGAMSTAVFHQLAAEAALAQRFRVQLIPRLSLADTAEALAAHLERLEQDHPGLVIAPAAIDEAVRVTAAACGGAPGAALDLLRRACRAMEPKPGETRAAGQKCIVDRAAVLLAARPEGDGTKPTER